MFLGTLLLSFFHRIIFYNHKNFLILNSTFVVITFTYSSIFNFVTHFTYFDDLSLFRLIVTFFSYFLLLHVYSIFASFVTLSRHFAILLTSYVRNFANFDPFFHSFDFLFQFYTFFTIFALFLCYFFISVLLLCNFVNFSSYSFSCTYSIFMQFCIFALLLCIPNFANFVRLLRNFTNVPVLHFFDDFALFLFFYAIIFQFYREMK